MNSSSIDIRGFTLIELLLVIAITSVIGATAIPAGSGFLVRNYHANSTNEVVSSLRTAQLRAMSGKGNSRWGVKITAFHIIVFQGDSYSVRTPAFDETYTIPSSIGITPQEVVFAKGTGNPGATASISITSNVGNIRTVFVNEVGTVNVQ